MKSRFFQVLKLHEFKWKYVTDGESISVKLNALWFSLSRESVKILIPYNDVVAIQTFNKTPFKYSNILKEGRIDNFLFIRRKAGVIKNVLTMGMIFVVSQNIVFLRHHQR